MCTSSGVSSSSRRKAFHENMMQKQIRRTLCWQPREIGLTTYVPLACDSGIRTARPSPMIDKIDKWCGQNALKQMVVKYRDDRTIEWQNAKDFGGAVRHSLPIAIWISDSAMTQIEFFCSAVFSFVPVNRPHCGNLSFIECKWAKWMMMRRSDASFGGGWCDETGNTWRGCFMSSNSSTVVANCDCELWAGRLIEWLTKTVGAVIVMSWLFASISRLSNLIYFHHVTMIQCQTDCQSSNKHIICLLMSSHVNPITQRYLLTVSSHV